MRVLRVYHSGVVTSFRNRDRAMRAMGHDVTLGTSQRWNEGGEVVPVGLGEEFVRPLRTFGSHPHAFVYDPVGLARLMRSGRWDVIDVHEEPSSLAAAEAFLLRWATRRKAPVLLYCAQNLEKRYPIPFRWIERWSFRTASAIYCCNRAAADILRRKGFRGRLLVLGLGVDPDQFRPDERSSAGDPFRIGYVGRVEERKGVFVLLDALAKTAGTRLDVYGGGPDLDRFEQEVARRGLADRVTSHGFVDHEQLPSIYRALDVLAVPSQRSRTWIEQFCRVAVEAMASGVPVVASDIGSLPEVVGDGGILVQPEDVAGFAEAVQQLVDDPAGWRALRGRARQRGESYSWESIARAHVELYEEVA